MKIIICITIVLSLQSCLILNDTKNKSRRCIAHNKFMRRAVVKTRYGFYCSTMNSSTYINARSQKCMGCVKPIWPKNRMAIIFVCRKCNKIKKHQKR